MSAPLPAGVADAARVPTALLERGVPLGPLWLLETRGRRSGRTRTVPVALVRHLGDRWLVSPFGPVAWVHNVRADPRASLRRGRRRRQVRLEEVTDARAPAVLRRYRRTFRAVPFVREAFDASPSDPVTAFAAEADRHPVFRLTGR